MHEHFGDEVRIPAGDVGVEAVLPVVARAAALQPVLLGQELEAPRRALGVADLASGDIVASPVRLYDSPAVRGSVWYDPLTSTPNAAMPSMAQTSETIDLLFMTTILSEVYVIILHPIVHLRHPLIGEKRVNHNSSTK